jgi:PAS domain S-box-containing protein
MELLENEINLAQEEIILPENTNIAHSYQIMTTVLNNIDALVYVIDLKTYKIEFANKKAKDQYGNIEGKVCWQVLQEGLHSACTQCKTENLYNDEDEIIDNVVFEMQNNVSKHWYEVRNQIIHWVDGRLMKLQIATDITEKRLLTDEIAKSEIKFRSIFEQSYDGIIINDENHKITEFNRGAEKITSINAKDAIGKNIEEFAFLKEIIIEANNISEPIEKQLNIGKKNEKTVQSIFSIIKTEKDIFGCTVIRDISENKKIHEELDRNLKFLQLVLDTLPSPIFIRDSNGVYISCNDKFAETIIGLPKNEVIGKSIFDLNKAVPKVLLDIYYRYDLDIIKSKGYKVFESEVLNIDGSKQIYQFNVAAFTTNNDIDTGIVGIMSDITNIVKIEKELKDAQNEKEFSGKAKLDFISALSHEVRTPLNAIMGFTDVLLERDEAQTMKNFLDIIKEASEKLLFLIDNVLDYTLLETNSLDLKYSAFNITESLLTVTDSFKDKIESSGINLLLNINPNIPKQIISDEIRFKQIFLNILSNAYKFTKHGFIKIELDFQYHEEIDDYIKLIFTVEDSGIGISPDNLDEIFDAFNLQSNLYTKKFKGTGLGLTITKSLLDKLKGTISIESEEDKGTKVNIKLPYTSYIQESNNIIEPKIKSNPLLKIKNSIVLIADDVQYNRDLIKEYINSLCINVLEADSGTETLEIINSIKPDMVLLDLKMPDISGYEVARIIREDDNLKDIPLIAFTAAVGQDSEGEDDNSLFNSFLLKPVNKVSLISELKKYLPITSFLKDLPINKIRKNINFKTQITSDIKEYIPEIVGILTNELEQKCDRALRSPTSDKVDSFIEDMELIAFKYQIEFIQKYCNSIKCSIKEENIDKLKQSLIEYPDLIERVKALKLKQEGKN